MCYNIKAILESQLKRARRQGHHEEVQELQLELFNRGITDLYQVSGFAHPKMLIYPDKESLPIPATWGLVPHWVKDEKHEDFWKKVNTLNAQGEKMFGLPSYRDSAVSKRCLIYVDGFYESHHIKGKTYPTYPFFIQRIDSEPFPLACLWSEWTNPITRIKLTSFAIVTTVGNRMLSKIHNNPKIEGPRMPVILPEELADEWINPSLSQKEVKDLLLPYPDELLKAHTVDRIAGKESKGNVPEAEEEFIYPEFKLN